MRRSRKARERGIAPLWGTRAEGVGRGATPRERMQRRTNAIVFVGRYTSLEASFRALRRTARGSVNRRSYPYRRFSWCRYGFRLK
jgi:hypothetical protein